MNAHRVVLVATLIVTACATAKGKPGLNPSPMNSDQTAVYRAFLGSYSQKGSALNLARRTVPFDFLRERGTECLRGIRFSAPDVSASVHEFDAGTLPSTITLVDSEEQERIIRNVDSKQTWRDNKFVNESLEKAQAAGFLILSEVAFDKKHEYAVVTFRFECWGLCGSGGTVVFKKHDGTWTPSSRACPLWAS
jgi:hypothetical protein